MDVVVPSMNKILVDVAEDSVGLARRAVYIGAVFCGQTTLTVPYDITFYDMNPGPGVYTMFLALDATNMQTIDVHICMEDNVSASKCYYYATIESGKWQEVTYPIPGHGGTNIKVWPRLVADSDIQLNSGRMFFIYYPQR